MNYVDILMHLNILYVFDEWEEHEYIDRFLSQKIKDKPEWYKERLKDPDFYENKSK